MYKKILIAIIGIWINSLSYSQSWVTIGTNENGQVTYLDKSSTKDLGNNIKSAWTKFEKKKLIYTIYSEYDCKYKTIKDIKLIVKETNGTILFNDTKKESEQKASYIPEGAIGRAILKYLCN